MDSKQWLKKNASKYQTKIELIKAGIDTLKLSESGIRYHIKRLNLIFKPKEKFNSSLSLDQFKNKDISNKIFEGLQILGNNVIKDGNFKNELEIGNKIWYNQSRDEKFDKYKLETKKGIFWGQPEILENLKQLIGV